MKNLHIVTVQTYRQLQTVCLCLNLRLLPREQNEIKTSFCSQVDNPQKNINLKVTIMNAKILISVAAAALVTLAGCSTNPTNAQIGTGVGAVAGGLVGNAVLGGTLGTVGGAAAGALIGNEVGKKK